MWERAIQLDPKYAEAYAGVGLTYLLEGRTFQSTGSSQAFDQAYQWAQKAIALNDSEPQANMLLGVIDLMKRRYDQAISEAQRAVAIARAPSMARDLEVRALCVRRPHRALAKRKGVTAR